MAGLDWFYKKFATGVARKLLAMAAAWLLTQGVFDSQDMPVILSKIAEASPLLVSLAWDWYAKQRDAKEHQVAVETSPLSHTAIRDMAKTTTLKRAA